MGAGEKKEPSTFRIHHLTSIDSTNDYLKKMMEAHEFTCVVADGQTAGRGRHGRNWHSAPGEGLYLSVLLCPQAPAAKIPSLSLMAGIAVAEVLLARDVPSVDIKWPNDVLVNERKVCGILVEGTSIGSDRHRIILGIGVNLNHRSFPQKLSQTATSLLIETGRPVDIVDFRQQLLERIAHWYERWKQSDEVIDRFQELSSYARGKAVIVTLDDGQITGETAGLLPTGALRVATGDGKVRQILAGDVMRLRSERSGERKYEINEK
ncbi:MAG: biotin--[acetyl-CoA-carboxylase] ligase [Blastocatellia bacterium]|nr:biotin--[acetyl-CoA-carboxylase] ligase [Blastocatellia bacterium]